jgi:hypothetical protein
VSDLDLGSTAPRGQIKSDSKNSVLWIRISFNANADPFFYVNADANLDLDFGQTSKSKKVSFMKKFSFLVLFKVDNRSKSIPTTKVQKPF